MSKQSLLDISPIRGGATKGREWFRAHTNYGVRDSSVIQSRHPCEEVESNNVVNFLF